MLYHIDNTPEMPSDRFGTGGKQQFTDPVDPTDRAYINYGIQKGIEICYGKWREVYGCPDKYYSGTDNRIFGDWLVGIYINSKTDFDLYREKIEEEKVIINNDDKIIIVLCALIVFLTGALVFVLI